MHSKLFVSWLLPVLRDGTAYSAEAERANDKAGAREASDIEAIMKSKRKTASFYSRSLQSFSACRGSGRAQRTHVSHRL